MEVAQQLFTAQGYPDTTVDDIARTAGASRATFYLHFKSKAELMGALMDAAVPMAVETYHVLDEQLAEDGPQLASRCAGGWRSGWNAGPTALRRRTPRCRPRCLSLRSNCITCGCRRLWSTAWSGFFGRLPADAREIARERALVLEIMTQRIFALASRSKLPCRRTACSTSWPSSGYRSSPATLPRVGDATEPTATALPSSS